MATQPNLHGALRFGYVVVGLAMMMWGFFFADPGFARFFWPIAGAVVLTEGLIGFCVVRQMFGLTGKKS
jgi:hypothetical protein